MTRIKPDGATAEIERDFFLLDFIKSKAEKIYENTRFNEKKNSESFRY